MALTDALYPFYGVNHLASQHGRRWSELVNYIRTVDVSDPHAMAFTLTIRRIRKANRLERSSCSDPFCAVCAAEVLSHFHGTEEELLRFYYKNLDEVKMTIKQIRLTRVERVAAAVA